MKCLSIKQPFADLIISGKKKIEIRSWKTSYRGELLIHASKMPDKYALRRFGIKKENIDLGKLIGKANLVECKEYKSRKEFLSDKRFHLSESYKNRELFGFVLKNPIRFKIPVPLKGRLGIFDVKEI